MDAGYDGTGITGIEIIPSYSSDLSASVSEHTENQTKTASSSYSDSNFNASFQFEDSTRNIIWDVTSSTYFLPGQWAQIGFVLDTQPYDWEATYKEVSVNPFTSLTWASLPLLFPSFVGTSDTYLIVRAEIYDADNTSKLLGVLWAEDKADSLYFENDTMSELVSYQLYQSSSEISLDDLNDSILGSLGTSVGSGLLQVDPIPEPSEGSMLWVSLGLFGLSAYRRSGKMRSVP
jgi:hypothetical protein